MIMLNVELKIGTTTHFIHNMVCRIRTPAPPSYQAGQLLGGRRSDSAALNSAAISTQPATDF